MTTIAPKHCPNCPGRVQMETINQRCDKYGEYRRYKCSACEGRFSYRNGEPLLPQTKKPRRFKAILTPRPRRAFCQCGARVQNGSKSCTDCIRIRKRSREQRKRDWAVFELQCSLADDREGEIA